MNERTRFTGLPTAIVLIASITTSSTGGEEKSKRAVSPPSMSKLAEAPVFAPLPGEQMIAVFLGSEANGPAAKSRYSLDGGRTWSEKPELLCALPKDLVGWGLHNVMVDHHGELHVFLTNDAKTSGKGLYEMRLDIYHLGSTNGRKTWKAPVLVRKGYYGSMQSVIELDWNCAKEECAISIDGHSAKPLHMQRQSGGVKYLRLCSTAEGIDTAGLLLESVDASVSK